MFMTIFWPFYGGNVFKLYFKSLNWICLLHFGIRKSKFHYFKCLKLKNQGFLDFLACNWALLFWTLFFWKIFWVYISQKIFRGDEDWTMINFPFIKIQKLGYEFHIYQKHEQGITLNFFYFQGWAPKLVYFQER